MFGLGFSEMVVIGLVLLVVVGPRELPKLLRAVGGGLNKLREMSADLRDQSGIDAIISDENLRDDLNTIRSISSGNVVGNLIREANRSPRPRPAPAPLPKSELSPPEGEAPDPLQEYPEVGCDAYGADDVAEPLVTGLHHDADVAAEMAEDAVEPTGEQANEQAVEAAS